MASYASPLMVAFDRIESTQVASDSFAEGTPLAQFISDFLSFLLIKDDQTAERFTRGSSAITVRFNHPRGRLCYWTFDRTWYTSSSEKPSFTGQREPDGFRAKFTPEELYSLLVNSGAVTQMQFYALLVNPLTKELRAFPLMWNRVANPEAEVPAGLGK
jgi:hypothetical protein